MSTDVVTPVYEGPFDMLLQLILREQVDIYEVNLSNIVDAYLTEIERAGFASVPQAELDAAETLGFRRVQTVWYVIAPHVVRALYPALSNHYIIMTLGTSMAAIFGVEELTGRALNANAISFRSVEIFSITALIYIALTIIASTLLWALGRWLFRVKARIF